MPLDLIESSLPPLGRLSPLLEPILHLLPLGVRAERAHLPVEPPKFGCETLIVL